MAQVKIEIESTSFRRGGHVMTVDLTKFNPKILAQLVMHGAAQKIGDAAAGKDGDEALKAMQAVIATLESGDWGRTRGGTGEEPIMRYVRQVIRGLLSDASKAEFKAVDAKDRDAWLQAKFDGLSDDRQARVREAAEKLMEEDLKRKAAAKKLVDGVAIDL